MKLSDLKKDQQYFTGQLSEINRKIAFAGIAIVWIFKLEDQGIYMIPKGLLIPVLFLLISLALDLLQYIYSSIIWTRVLRKQEKKYSADEEFKVSKIYSNISYRLFFYPKVISSTIAYIFLFVHLGTLLNSGN